MGLMLSELPKLKVAFFVKYCPFPSAPFSCSENMFTATKKLLSYKLHSLLLQ